MKAPQIFGREPVIITNFIEGVLYILLAFKILNPIGIDTAEEMALIMAVVTTAMGVYVAYLTKDTLLGAVQGLIKAGVVLAAAFGYSLTSEQTGAVMGALVVVFAMWHRTQTGPAIVPTLDISSHTVLVPSADASSAVGQALATEAGLDQGSGALVEKPAGSGKLD